MTGREKKPPMKKPQRSTAGAVAQTAWKAFKMANTVRSLINVETKYKDYDRTETSINQNGVLRTLNDPAQGTSASTRVGDSILMKSIDIRGEIYANTSPAYLRMILIIDKQNTITTAAQILENTGTYYSVHSQYNQDNRKQFSVLYDRTRFVDQTTNQDNHLFHIRKKLSRHVKFDTGTITINTGALKLLCISNANVAAAEPTTRYRSRFTYIDN